MTLLRTDDEREALSPPSSAAPLPAWVWAALAILLLGAGTTAAVWVTTGPRGDAAQARAATGLELGELQGDRAHGRGGDEGGGRAHRGGDDDREPRADREDERSAGTELARAREAVVDRDGDRHRGGEVERGGGVVGILGAVGWCADRRG